MRPESGGSVAPRRRLVATSAMVLLVAVLTTFTVRSTFAASHDPASEGLAQVLSTLSGLDSSGPLGQPFPLSDTTPADLVGFDDLFDALAGALGDDALAPSDLEDLEGTHGPFAVVVNGPGGADEAVVAPSSGDADIRDVIFEVVATADDVELPVSVADDLVSLDGSTGPGGTVTVDVVLSSTMLHFQYDDSETDPSLLPQALWLRTMPAAPVPVGEREAPAFDLTLTASGEDVDAFTASVGLGDVEVTGTLDLNARIQMALVDPDGTSSDDKISLDEFVATPVVDLADVAFVDVPSVDDINASLTLSATALTGIADATVGLVDADLSSDPPPTPTFALGEQENLLNMTPSDLISAVDRLAGWLGGLGATGRLDAEIPFVGGSFSDALDMAAELASLTEPASDVLRHAGNVAGTPVDETGLPKFRTLGELDALLTAAGYPVAFDYDLDSHTVRFDLSVSDSFTRGLPIALGSLDVVDDIQVTASGTANLEAAYEAGLGVALDISPLPEEGPDAGPLSCVDGLDNDSADGIDAADPECATTPTLEQRILLDVGTSAGTPEITGELDFATTDLEAVGTIGLLGVQLGPVEASLGDGDGNPAAITVDLYESGAGADGFLTIEELLNAFGGTPGNAAVDQQLDAHFEATVPVGATLSGVALGGGDIAVTADVDGPFTDPGALLADGTFTVDASGLHTGAIFDFSPCANSLDDDGDGTANDGCPGGPAPVSDPETSSTAGLQAIIDLIRALGTQLGGGGLDVEIPLVGRSFDDLVDLASPLGTLADRLATPAESSIPGACDVGDTTDDDFDGAVNDGCPSRQPLPPEPGVGPAPEVGAHCANDDDDDGDGYANDGCLPVSPSLQTITGFVEGVINDELTEALDGLKLGTSTPTVTVDVGLTYDDAAGDLLFLLDATLGVRTGTTFNFNLGEAVPALAGYQIVALDTTGSIALDVNADLTVGFGMEMATYRPFMLGDTALTVDVDAVGEDLELGAGIGPVKIQLGNAAPVPEEGADCDNTTDDDGDGFANDGCPAQATPESGADCANGLDDDTDGIADDGCPNAAAQEGDDPESGGDCGNGVDNDDDGIADDGCGSNTASAADEGGPSGEDASAGDCDRGDTDDDDADDALNDGCPARGNPGLAYAGATFGLEEAGADGAKHYFSDGGPLVDFSGSPGLAGSPPAQCDDLVGNADADACAYLPIYLDVNGSLVYLSPLTIDWDDFTSAPNVTVDQTALLDALEQQMLDLLLLKSGLGGWLTKIEALLRDGLFGLDLPLIGSAFDEAADFVAGLRDAEAALSGALPSNPIAGAASVGAVQAQVASLASAVDTAIDDAYQQPGGVAAPVTAEVRCDDGGTVAICDGDESLDAIEEIVLDIPLGQEGTASTPAFDIGVPGLSLSSDDTLDATGAWSVTLGLGVSRTEGFFLDTGADDELSLAAEIDLPDHMEGRLGFLQVDIFDGGPSTACSSGSEDLHSSGVRTCDVDNDGVALPASSFDPSFTVDLLGRGDDRLTLHDLTVGGSFADLFTYDLTVPADVNLHLVTSVADTGGSFPRLLADLTLDWGFALTNATDPGQLRDPAELDIALSNTALDAGSFLRDFLGPIVRDAQKFTKPLDPVIEQLTAPIPVLSDFAGKPVTLLDLVETFSSGEVDLGLLYDLVKMVDFVNGLNIPSDPNALFVVPFGGGGGFDLDAPTLLAGPLDQSQARGVYDPAQLASLDAGGSLVGALDGAVPGDASAAEVNSASGLAEIGLFFPFLDRPSQLLGLLFGQDVDLIIWQPDELKAEFSYSQKFGPIWAVPPVFLEIGGSAAVTGRFGIGYDTQGLREVLFEGADAGALLHGMFLLDQRLNPDGTFAPGDPAEIELKGRLFANAQVSVVIFSAGAEGAVELTVGLNVHDDNDDGKLKYQEAANILRATANPICLFDFEGRFGVAIDVFAEVDLFFWSHKWVKNLADIILYEWEVSCEGLKEPTLASPATLDLDDTAAYPRPDGSTGEFFGSGDENVLQLNLGALRTQRGSNTVGEHETNEEFVAKKQLDGSVSVTALGITQNFPAPSGGWDAVLIDGGDDDDSDATDPGFDVITLADNVQKGESAPVAGNNSVNRCAGAGDDDADGAVNDGCPAAGPPESGALCANGTDDDADGLVNDGCPVLETRVDFDLDAYIRGSNGADHITGGHGKNVVFGRNGSDKITTKESTDKVSAGNGDDQISVGNNPAGGGKEDYVDGGAANDVIDGGPGADILLGSSGDDRITGGLTIPAQPGNPAKLTSPIPEQPDLADRIEGGSGADDLDGGPGGDVVIGGSGPDRINGGEGNDTVWGNGEDDPAESVTDTCAGFPADNSYDDVVVGGPGADTVHAGAGDDIVVGGNILAGGADVGDTLLAGDPGCDLVLGDNASFADANDPRKFTFIDPQIGGGDRLEGGSGADVIHGMIGDDTAFGGGGGDTIFGQAGHDVLDGDAGNDTVWGDGGPNQPVPYPGAGDDDVIGGDGDDVLEGEEGVDIMLGDRGTVDRKGTAGRDDDTVSLAGGDGVDTMRGGRGTDRMYGQGGNDIMHGDADDDLMLGNDGADDMRGGTGEDQMFGGDGDTGVSPAVGDTMRGDAGDDRMVGGSDVDAGWPKADDGGDTMFGGSGKDVMVGDNGVINPTQVETLQSVGTPAQLASFGGAGDLMYGEADTDRLYGEVGNDRLFGGTGDDYLEGNANGDGPPEGVDRCDDLLTDPHADVLFGQADQDDLIGGGHFTGHADGADCMFGGGSVDVMAGDNALITRPGGFDAYDGAVRRTVELLDLLTAPAGIAGADVMYGEDGPDRMFGGGADEQLMRGGSGDDYMEGNGGGDTVYGDADQDDIIGGTSQADGAASVFTGRHVAPGGNPPAGPVGGSIPDGADVIFGDDETDPLTGGTADDHDLITGDNASLIRPVDGESLWFQDDLDTSRGVTDVVRRVLQLFDVATSDDADAETGVSGADELYGQNGFDVVYGQGAGDVLRGGLLDDYLEGGNGSDDVQGNDGQDDIVGGTGRTRTDDPASADDGRLDVGDTLYGGNGDPSEENDGTDDDDFDVIMGDNATVLRGATGAPGEAWTHHDFGGAGTPIVDRTVTLHDVETLDYAPPAGTSGGDTLYGEDADDLLYGQGGNDTAHGGGGDDVIEGNAGDDGLYGEGDQDDMLGGTGLIRWWDELAGAVKVDSYDLAQLVGGTAGRVDGADTMYGGGDHDVMLGDNGIVDRLPGGASTWSALAYGHFPVQHDATDSVNPPVVSGSFTRWGRAVRMTDPPVSAGGSPRTSGSDLMSGGDGDDDMYGQFDDTADDADGAFTLTAAQLRDLCPTSEIGDPDDGVVELWGDLVCGGAGEDAILGDQGVVTNEVATGPATFIEPKDPFVTEWIDIPGSLVRRTELTTFAAGGGDVLLGGDGGDSIHAGAGGDVANAGTGDDRVFGGDSPRIGPDVRLDALWGGPDNDHVYGGHGDDFIDVQPRSGVANFPDDPEQWFVFAPLVDTDADGAADRFPGFEDFDQHYGGWNQDAFQADKGDNGPIRGDRLLDWAGAHNVYYLCPSTYGAYVSIRAQEPGLVEYLESMAEGDGLVAVRTAGSSGYNELAMVYKPDIKHNANPAHPDTPGHFSCDFVP